MNTERVIKFRVLDKDNKAMSEGLPFEWFIRGEGTDMEFPKDETSLPLKDFCYYFDDYEIMQFTGLHDRNGKEIYEGDIVKWSHPVFDLDKPEGEDKSFKNDISVVEYRGHGFWIREEHFGWEGESLWNWDELEVIGNIYEHPELLNQLKTDF